MTERTLNGLNLLRALAEQDSIMELENGSCFSIDRLTETEAELLKGAVEFVDAALDHYAECGFHEYRMEVALRGSAN